MYLNYIYIYMYVCIGRLLKVHSLTLSPSRFSAYIYIYIYIYILFQRYYSLKTMLGK